ncbi:FAD-dependent monooxygenase [Bradyrhizobium sp. Arg816]|uniref:FAD-dependent monooxygenase n=1 Tax=Bradyrhizobium sp. Arg816 TaxID=2998491 RepID=UPI00249DF22B|nr:FAD-dependent monooxygenase [Bradyrhizobium sp. Arg816]MDI3567477.1 FAD-dependent monooxygenase [Bradyrhizobium sp. Arg816]
MTLLGDAAHPMMPHFGQGAGQAIEDGFALAVLLEHAKREDPSASEGLSGAEITADQPRVSRLAPGRQVLPIRGRGSSGTGGEDAGMDVGRRLDISARCGEGRFGTSVGRTSKTEFC